MIPDFKITADDIDITQLINERLIMLSIHDEAGLVSDSLNISLDNRDQALEMPPRGAILSVALGYKQSGILPMGKFVVDEVEFSYPAGQMQIMARSSDSFDRETLSSIKAVKNRSWHQKTYADIIMIIASEHSLKPLIDEEYKELFIDHIDQTDESDMAFLNRILCEASGYLKVAGGMMIAGLKGSGKAPNGADLPEIFVTADKISDWRVRIAERGKFLKCEAKYHNKSKGIQEKVSFGNSEPAFCIEYVYASKKTAQRAAKAKFQEMERGIYCLELNCIGNPEILAMSFLNLKEISPLIDSLWIVETCDHELSNSGYKTKITATKQGK